MQNTYTLTATQNLYHNDEVADGLSTIPSGKVIVPKGGEVTLTINPTAIGSNGAFTYKGQNLFDHHEVGCCSFGEGCYAGKGLVLSDTSLPPLGWGCCCGSVATFNNDGMVVVQAEAVYHNM